MLGYYDNVIEGWKRFINSFIIDPYKNSSPIDTRLFLLNKIEKTRGSIFNLYYLTESKIMYYNYLEIDKFIYNIPVLNINNSHSFKKHETFINIFFEKIKLYFLFKLSFLSLYYIFFILVFFEFNIVSWWYFGCKSWLFLPIFIIFIDAYYHPMWYVKIELVIMNFIFKVFNLPSENLKSIKVKINNDDGIPNKICILKINYLDFR